MAIQPTFHISADTYFRMADYQKHDLIQLINGEVMISMPPIPRHQEIVGEIFFMLKSIAKSTGGKAYTSPIEVYLDERNVYEPDVLYMTPDSNCEVGDKRLMGAPELIVEVLSPSTAKYDRQQKYVSYQQHGVKEYWIVDSVHELIEVWVLQESTFVRQGVYDVDDMLTSPTLATNIVIKAIFEA